MTIEERKAQIKAKWEDPKQNHYKWLELCFNQFCTKVGNLTGWDSRSDARGMIGAHGDKCYGYQSEWEHLGIPFRFGVAIYLLTYMSPYSSECRETDHGWVPPLDWVISVYPKFKPILEEIDNALPETVKEVSEEFLDKMTE